MSELLENAAGFLLILLLPLVLIAGGLLTLFAIGALFEALDNLHEVRGRIESAFRRPPPPARLVGPDHYYRPYWTGRS